MPDDGFAAVQRQLEERLAELKTCTDPARRRVLFREMSQLLADAQRISSQPPRVRKADD
jgi:hypothetical protein